MVVPPSRDRRPSRDSAVPGAGAPGAGRTPAQRSAPYQGARPGAGTGPRPAHRSPSQSTVDAPSVPRPRTADATTQLVPAVPSHRRPSRRFQVAGVLILVVGAIAGSFGVLSRDPAPAPSADTVAADGAAPAEEAWRVYARQKAEEVAAAQAEQARRAAEIAAAQEAARQAPPAPNIPSSCDEYTGNRALGCALMLEAGYGLDQMGCLERLWTKESNWRAEAHNQSSGAHGIPQALPGEKMAVFGADWATNPVTQILWGLDYIKKRYGTPCGAWEFWQSHNWY